MVSVLPAAWRLFRTHKHTTQIDRPWSAHVHVFTMLAIYIHKP